MAKKINKKNIQQTAKKLQTKNKKGKVAKISFAGRAQQIAALQKQVKLLTKQLNALIKNSPKPKINKKKVVSKKKVNSKKSKPDKKTTFKKSGKLSKSASKIIKRFNALKDSEKRNSIKRDNRWKDWVVNNREKRLRQWEKGNFKNIKSRSSKKMQNSMPMTEQEVQHLHTQVKNGVWQEELSSAGNFVYRDEAGNIVAALGFVGNLSRK